MFPRLVWVGNTHDFNLLLPTRHMHVDQIADSLVHRRLSNWRIHADATKIWFRLVLSNHGDGLERAVFTLVVNSGAKKT